MPRRGQVAGDTTDDEVNAYDDANAHCTLADPICFTSPEGFAYYLPAFVRLALAEPIEPHGWYGSQLLFHLCSDGRRNERVLACTVQESRAVVAFLQHLVETRSQLADSYHRSDELFQAI